MAIETKLQELLTVEIDTRFPQTGKKSEPAWSVFLLQNPAAPIVSISRDARAGERAAPVFFATAPDVPALLDFAKGLYRSTEGRVPLWHSATGAITYLVIPALFHSDPNIDRFVSVLSGELEDFARKHEAAWVCEKCAVLITHYGKTFKAVRDADSLRVVQS